MHTKHPNEPEPTLATHGVPCEICGTQFIQDEDQTYCVPCTKKEELKAEDPQAPEKWVASLKDKYPNSNEDKALDFMPQWLEDLFKEKARYFDDYS